MVYFREFVYYAGEGNTIGREAYCDSLSIEITNAGHEFGGAERLSETVKHHVSNLPPKSYAFWPEVDREIARRGTGSPIPKSPRAETAPQVAAPCDLNL